MDRDHGTWADCGACGGAGCRHCDFTGLGIWLEGADDGDDGDTRRHDAPYDFTGGRAAA